MRAAGQYLEEWIIVLTNPTTASTITTNKLTRPVTTEVFDVSSAGSAVANTPTITPLASGTATVAFTGLTTDKTFLVRIRGTR